MAGEKTQIKGSEWWNVIEKDAFKENPVHGYERISYDVSLHLANTKDTKAWMRAERKLENHPEMNSINSPMFKGDVICIMESASTQTTLTNLWIEGIVSPTKSQDTGFSTRWKMDVVQPLGVSLIENIYKAAAVLGIPNHYNHPYFLQIVLKGRKANGEIETEIPGTRRLYGVYIKNIIYNVDVGSSNYQIEGIRIGNLNDADDHSLVQKTVLENIVTMKDFLEVFQKEVNNQERHKLGSTKGVLDQYIFRLNKTRDCKMSLKEIYNSQVIGDKQDHKKNTLNTDKGGEMFGIIERNTSIKKVLERFMCRNDVMLNRMDALREGLLNLNMADDKEVQQMEIGKHLFTITTHNELLTYDALRRDYARKYCWTITVNPFNSVGAAVRKEYNKLPSYIKKVVKDSMVTKKLVKRYDYFNTGMNLDVLNFNINYNYQYVYGLDTMVGLFNKYAEQFRTVINTGLSNQSDINKAKETGEHQNKKFNEMSGDGKLTSAEKYAIKVMQEKNLRQIKKMYDSGVIEPDANTLEAYNALVKDYNETFEQYADQGGKTIVDPGLARAAGIEGTTPKLNALDGYSDSQMKGFSLHNASGTDRVSKLGGNNILAETMKDELYEEALLEDQGGTQFPIQFYERFVSPDDEGLFSVESGGDSSGFSTVLRNAKVGTAEMVKVSMDIIGDPYWLDHPAYSHNEEEDVDGNGHPTMANYKKENLILFCSQMPVPPKDADGYMAAPATRTNNFLTALYRVYKVEHKFSNGQFLQTLHMIRDGISDLSLLLPGDIKASDVNNDNTDSTAILGYENHTDWQGTQDHNAAGKKGEPVPLKANDKRMQYKMNDIHGTLVGENVAKGEIKQNFIENHVRTDIDKKDLDNPDKVEFYKDMQDTLGYNHGGAMSLKERAAYDGFDISTPNGMKEYREFLNNQGKTEAEEINEKNDPDDGQVEAESGSVSEKSKEIYVPNLESVDDLNLYNQMRDGLVIIKE
ncbi:MAG: hypothetical protein CMA64_11290 [Euryarchaeota archaeon]|nr:hypothetical protein [Euryarchaeota archaeon]